MAESVANVGAPFRFRFRVRYQECDAQKIVFNSRWGEYVDVASTELARVAFGEPEAVEWRLVRQVTEWKRPGRYDDVIEARLWTRAVGRTSFTVATELVRVADETLLVTVETVYVMVDPATERGRPITDEERRLLFDNAAGALVDCSGQRG